jgi:hypothetical protein
MRIEKRLNKLDGVSATVNYGTEKAKVTFPGTLAPDELVAAVEQAGYTARLPEPRRAQKPRPRRSRTPWSRWARCPRWAGRCTRCSSAPPARPG